MPAEITMPQLSDTMTEGTVVKWHKKEGDKVRAGEEVVDVETDKATMPFEAAESGTLAAILVKEGQKVPVGALIAVVATAKENAADVKKQYAAQASGGGGGAKAPAAGPGAARPAGDVPGGAAKTGAVGGPAAPGAGAGAGSGAGAAATPRQAPSGAKPPAPAATAAPTPSRVPPTKSEPGRYQFDLVVIGGGPGGYAAAIRAGQLKK